MEHDWGKETQMQFNIWYLFWTLIKALSLAATIDTGPFIDNVQLPCDNNTSTSDIPADVVLQNCLCNTDWIKAQNQDILIAFIIDHLRKG
jgi:hypothetical protein